MEPKYGSGSSIKYSKPITEATSIRLECSPSASSSSSDSSIIDRFQVTASSSSPGDSVKVVNEHNKDAQLAQKNNKYVLPLIDYDNLVSKDHGDISRNGSSKLEGNDEGSVGGTSPSIASDMRYESFQFHSMMQSPPLQVMGRSDYDPDRIPTSVFHASKESNRTEWSIDSNESLFSIHAENDSFSRDHVFWKSGELFKSGELIVYNPSPSPSQNPGPPVPVVEEINRMGVTVGNNSATTTVTSQTLTVTKEEDLIPPPPHLRAPQLSTNISSIFHKSDGSGNSTQSFAFPIKKKHSWNKCYCSNCSWAFCYCKWLSCIYRRPRCHCPKYSCPFCYCTWPSCHGKWPSRYCPKFSCVFCRCIWPSCHCNWPNCNYLKCSWAFCYHWICSGFRFCCGSSTILIEREIGKSAKKELEGKNLSAKVQSRWSISYSKSISFDTGWFSCLSCRPWSCSCRFSCCYCCCSCPSCCSCS